MRGQSFFVLFFYCWTSVFAAPVEVISTYKDINVEGYQKEWTDHSKTSGAARAEATRLHNLYKREVSIRQGHEVERGKMVTHLQEDEAEIIRLSGENRVLQGQIDGWNTTIAGQLASIATLGTTITGLEGDLDRKKTQIDRQAGIAKTSRDAMQDAALDMDDAEAKVDGLAAQLVKEEAKRDALSTAFNTVLENLKAKLAALETLKEARKKNALELVALRNQEGNLRAAIKADEDASKALVQKHADLKAKVTALQLQETQQKNLVAKLMADVADLEQTIEETHEEVEMLSERIETHREQIKKSNDALKSLAEEQRTTQVSRQQVTRKVELSQASVGDLAGKKSSAESQQGPLAKEKATLDAEMSARQKQIDDLSALITAKENEITAEEKVIEEAETKAQTAKTAIETAEAMGAALTKKSADIQAQVESLQKQAKEKGELSEPKKQKVSTLKAEIEGLKTAEADLKKQVAAAKAEADRLSAILNPGIEKLKALKADLAALEAQRKALVAAVAKLDAELASATKSAATAEAELSSTKSAVTEKEKELEEAKKGAEATKAEREKQIAEAKAESAKLAGERASVDQEKTKLDADLSSKQAALTKIEAEQKTVAAEQAAVQKAQAEAQEKVTEAVKQLTAFEQSKKTLDEREASISKTIADLEAKLEGAKKGLGPKSDERDQLKSELDELKKIESALNQKLATVNAQIKEIESDDTQEKALAAAKAQLSKLQDLQSDLEQRLAATKQAEATAAAAVKAAEARLAEEKTELAQKENEVKAKRVELKQLRAEAGEEGDVDKEQGQEGGDESEKKKRKEHREKRQKARALVLEIKKLESEIEASQKQIGVAEQRITDLKEESTKQAASAQKTEDSLTAVKSDVVEAQKEVTRLSTVSPEKKEKLEKLLAQRAEIETEIAQNLKAEAQKSQALAAAEEAVSKLSALVASLGSELAAAQQAQATLPGEIAKVDQQIAGAKQSQASAEKALENAALALKTATAKGEGLTQDASEARMALSEAQKKQGEAAAMLADLDTQIKNLGDRVAKLEASLGQAPEVAQLEKELAALKQQVVSQEAALDAAQKAVTKVTTDKAESEKDLATTEAKLPGVQKGVTELEASLGETQAQSAAAEAKKAELEKLLTANQKEQSSKATEAANLESEAATLDAAIAKLQSEIKAQLAEQEKIPAALTQAQADMKAARAALADAESAKAKSEKQLVDLKLKKTELLVKLTPITTAQQLARARSEELGRQIAKLKEDAATFTQQLADAQKLLDAHLAEQAKLVERLGEIPAEMVALQDKVKNEESRMALVEKERHSLSELDKGLHARETQAQLSLERAEADLARTQVDLQAPQVELAKVDAEAKRLSDSLASLGKQLVDNQAQQTAKVDLDKTQGKQIDLIVVTDLPALEKMQAAARTNLDNQWIAISRVQTDQAAWQRQLDARQVSFLRAEADYAQELKTLTSLDEEHDALSSRHATAFKQRAALEADNKRLAAAIVANDTKMTANRTKSGVLATHVAELKRDIPEIDKEIAQAKSTELKAWDTFKAQDATALALEKITAAKHARYQEEEKKLSDALVVVVAQARKDATVPAQKLADSKADPTAYALGKTNGEAQGTALGKSQGEARDRAQGIKEGKEREIKLGLATLKTWGLDKPYQEGMALSQKLGDTEGEPIGFSVGHAQEYTDKNRKAGEAAGYQDGWSRAKKDAVADYNQAKKDTKASIETNFKPKDILEVDNKEDAQPPAPVGPAPKAARIGNNGGIVSRVYNWLVPVADANTVVVPKFDIPVVVSDKAYARDYQHVTLNAAYVQAYDAEYVKAFNSRYDSIYRTAYQRGYNEVFESFRVAAEKVLYAVAKAEGDKKGAAEGKAQMDAHLAGYRIGYARGKAVGETKGRDKAYSEGYQSQTAGEPFGYSENIAGEREKAKQAGIAEVTDFYQTHAVPNAVELKLVDGTGNGKFDFNEAVTASVKLRNFGGLDAFAEELEVRVTAVNGLQLNEKAPVKLKALPAENEVTFTNVLSGKITSRSEVSLDVAILYNGQPVGNLQFKQKIESQIKVLLTHIHQKTADKPLWVSQWGGKTWTNNRLWIHNNSNEDFVHPLKVIVTPKNEEGSNNVQVLQSTWKNGLDVRVPRTLDPLKPNWANADFGLYVREEADLSQQVFTVTVKQQWDNFGRQILPDGKILHTQEITIPVELTGTYLSPLKVVLDPAGAAKSLKLKQFGGTEWTKNTLHVSSNEDYVHPLKVIIIPKDSSGSNNVRVHQSVWKEAIDLQVTQTTDPKQPNWAALNFHLWVQRSADLSKQVFTIQIKQEKDNAGNLIPNGKILYSRDVVLPIEVQ